MRRASVIRPLLLALAGLALLAAPAAAAPAVSGEFAVENLDSNNKLVQGPDGNMWVTLAGPKDVAKVTPAGVVTEYDLGIEGASGITVAGGEIWVSRNGGVTQFKPGNPEVDKISTLIEPVVSSPIVLAPDGNIWAAANEKLVRIPPADPSKFKSFTVAGLGPRDIDVAGSLLVIADFGSARVLTATTADPPVTKEFKLNGGSQGVAGNAAGQIAFSQQGQMPTEFGLISPPNPPVLTLSPGTDPFGVTLGPDGAFWVVQFNTNTITRLGTDNVATTIAPGFAAASGPRQIAPGPDNTLWVTLQNAKKVGRISGVELAPPPPPPPPTKAKAQLKKGPKRVVRTGKRKARVSFRFSSDDAAASFQCRLFGLPPKGATKQGGKKAGTSAGKIKLPVFKTCRSPKRYGLKPGRYRFQVRAVNAAGAGAPAKRTFRVVRVAR